MTTKPHPLAPWTGDSSAQEWREGGELAAAVAAMEVTVSAPEDSGTRAVDAVTLLMRERDAYRDRLRVIEKGGATVHALLVSPEFRAGHRIRFKNTLGAEWILFLNRWGAVSCLEVGEDDGTACAWAANPVDLDAPAVLLPPESM